VWFFILNKIRHCDEKDMNLSAFSYQRTGPWLETLKKKDGFTAFGAITGNKVSVIGKTVIFLRVMQNALLN
jgi:hypothetical protein